MKNLLILLTLLSTYVFAQDKIELKQDTKAGIYVLQPSGTIPIPPIDCAKCLGIDPIVVDPVTGIMIITYSNGTQYISPPLKGPKGDKGDTGPQGPQGIQGIQGPPGICPSCPGTGGSQTRNTFDVMNYGANPNDNINDLPAFQAAYDAAKLVSGKVIVSPGAGTFYLDGTWNITPDASNQVWVDIEQVGGRAGTIRYRGPSGQPVVRIVGLKGAIWTGLNIAIEDGRTGVQVFDIQTTSSSGSSSFNTFKTFYLNLGNGQNNVGIRTGFVEGGGKDISNYAFESIVVFGGGKLGQSGEAITIPGQYAFLNLGDNTLSMVWKDGFVAGCDRVYSNKFESRRGNGSVMFYGLGGSQNNIDFEFAWEQSYIVSGGRWEGGNKFMLISDGGFSNVVVQGLTIHDYKANEGLIEARVAASIKLDGVFATWTHMDSQGNPTKTYNHIVTLSASDAARPRAGSLKIDGGGFSANKPYSKSGSAEWGVKVSDVGKIRVQYSESLFPDESLRIP
jgi:hypothetical protein